MDNEAKTKTIHFELGNINTFSNLQYNCAEYDNFGDNYNHIIDNVYVGNIFSFGDNNFIAGLDQIISLVKPPSSMNHINSIDIFFDDMDYVDILPYAERVFALLDTGKKTLVHCLAGRSRSCAVVLYYIMKKHNKTFQEAHDILKAKRVDMCINRGFIRTLQQQEHYLRL